MEEEMRRQEDAYQRAEQERKARAQRAFDKVKADALTSLKGVTLNQNDGARGTASTLELKSGTPTFGIKGNPDGQLRLKTPEAVKIRNQERAIADPAFFTRPKSRLRIRGVPNPMRAPKDTWLHYVKSDRANLILDALEEGNGDLDRAIEYLDGQIIRHGTHVKASAAISYLEGLNTGYVAAGAEYTWRVKKTGEPATVEAKALLAAVAGSDARRWPGPANPDPGAKPLNIHDWRNQRTAKLLAALKATPGDLKKTYAVLQTDKDPVTAANAEHYLRGVFAYWDYLDLHGAKK
ncbi:MAG: hypothetical protein K9J74_06755 [Sulfuritalea sp.]|nr:hypothetical protein [Sulfuritalea sp.]